MTNKIKIKKGFSIGEVILSVFIVGMILTALITMYSTGIKEFLDERDSVVASLLAQEGVELIRNIRDNEWAKGDRMIDGLSDDPGCAIDINSSNCSGSNYDLNYSSGFFVNGSGSEFSRKIIINENAGSPGNPGEEKYRITSIVTWNHEPVGAYDEGSLSACSVSRKCVFSQAELTDWGDSNI